MSINRTLFALAAVLVGATFLARRAGAAELADEPADDDEFLAEIHITAQRLGQGGFTIDNILSTLTNAVTPLGIRNNNPLNIRETDINWQGELPHDGDGYEDFTDAGAGIRAGAVVLLNYWKLHRLNTVEGIISRWAPKEDNNPTAAYIAFVAKRLDVEPDQALKMTSVDVVAALATAIIEFENGKVPYTAPFIRQHVSRAFV